MHDALIIGVGAAGLAAPRVLTVAGVNTTVLEARQRAGGRCRGVLRSQSRELRR